MIEKKEKIFLGVVASYIIIALCFYTFNSPEYFIREILVGGLIVLVMFIKSKKLYIGIREILLLATVISWGIITEQVKLALATAILWFIYIYITKFLMSEGINRGIVEKVMWGIIITLTVGFTIHAVVDAGIFFARVDQFSVAYGSVYKDGTTTISWWDWFVKADIVRTQIGFLFITVLTCTLPLCIGKINFGYKILVIIIDVLLLFANLQSFGGGRIPFVCFFASLSIQTILFLFYKKRDGLMRKNRLICVGGVLILIFVVIFCVTNETVLHIIYRDGGIFHNIRFKWQTEVLKNILMYPMGVGSPEKSAEIFGFGYAHNVWVDFVLYAGVIPFLVFVIYTVYNIIDVAKYVKGNANILLKMAVCGMWIGYMLYYTVEPAFYASVEFIAPWFIINAVANVYNTGQREERRECI